MLQINLREFYKDDETGMQIIPTFSFLVPDNSTEDHIFRCIESVKSGFKEEVAIQAKEYNSIRLMTKDEVELYRASEEATEDEFPDEDD